MPQSTDMEEAVLSAMLMDDMAVIHAREIVSPQDFYADGRRHIYDAMCVLKDSGSVIDPLTLSSELERVGVLDKSGGKDYIGYLVDAAPTAANVVYHARVMRELSDRRAMIRIADTLRAAAVLGQRPASEIGAEAQALLLPVSTGSADKGFRRVRDVIPEILSDFEKAIRGELLGHPVGFRSIDRATGGMNGGDLIFLCGVPGGLKTILLLIICLLASMRGEGAAIFSAEMMAKALVKRLVQYLGRIESLPLRTGLFTDGDAVRIGETLGQITNLPLWIDQTPTPDINLCLARARTLKAQNPTIRWIGVDFIQLLESQTAEENRSRELTTIAYKLKAMAKELDVCVIATCQVDAKTIESRSQEKRPRLGDLQWSQGMRQAADFIALLYRPSLYSDVERDVLEIDFQKARDLAPFKVILNWEGKTMRLTDL